MGIYFVNYAGCWKETTTGKVLGMLLENVVFSSMLPPFFGRWRFMNDGSERIHFSAAQ
jgi:hypothetical protein